MHSFFDAAAAIETRNHEQVRSAIEESARLMRESLTYTTQLSADARKASIETARQVMATTQPKL